MNSGENRKVTIVILSKYSEVFAQCFETLNKFAADFPKIVVADGQEIVEYTATKGNPNDKWKLIVGPKQFAMAGNANIGWNAVAEDSDILYMGDDCRLLEFETVERLRDIAYSDASIGILSPRLLGRASNALANPSGELAFIRPLEMWFPCVYIKRELITKIGYLDERFNEFGSDDLDYCFRTQLIGYRLAVTSRVTVAHECSPEGGPTTFVKKLGVEGYQKQQEAAYKKLQEKYDVPAPIFERALRSGDTSLLAKKTEQKPAQPTQPKRPPSNEEAKEMLKQHSIYLATPAYGGAMTVNYVQSLLGLSDLCRAHDIKFAVSFVYNESLITRARNKMVADFLNNSEKYTDFFFIDADIGFNPRDIVSMIFYDEPIIGSPCVRKNLRLDRVAAAIKKNGKDYTIDEMQKLCGEFVVNFPPDSAPKSMNLGQLIEVQDVGTGLMRVKREVFDIIEKKFPDRYYFPMMGEGDETRPHYMFFQSGIDEESAKYNAGGYPHYIAEDYAFCRLARKCDMKVYLAPWLKTTHAGTYLFQGDLEAVAKSGGNLR